MAMYEKQVTCRRCGAKLTIWVPKGMSSFGIQAMSICDRCWNKEEGRGEEAMYGEDGPDKDN